MAMICGRTLFFFPLIQKHSNLLKNKAKQINNNNNKSPKLLCFLSHSALNNMARKHQKIIFYVSSIWHLKKPYKKTFCTLLVFNWQKYVPKKILLYLRHITKTEWKKKNPRKQKQNKQTNQKNPECNTLFTDAFYRLTWPKSYVFINFPCLFPEYAPGELMLWEL
jgi:hypothetical protein